MHALPDIVEHTVKKFREASQLMYDMASVYPGDITGEISKEGFLMEAMADILADANWFEVMMDYELNRPKIEITVYDSEENKVE